jgi:ribosome-binding protein aMBF1 (putative translation factor)
MATTVPDTASTRQEIARARQQMGQALFQLADRLAPKKLIPRVKEQAKLKATIKLEELKERVSPVRVIKRKLDSEPKPKVIPARGYESNGSRVKELT